MAISAVRVLAGLLALAFSTLSLAQTQSRTAPPTALPRDILYDLLFREIVNFNARADDLANQSKPDNFLRNRYRTAFDLSASLDSQLKQIAGDCTLSVADVDRRAYTIINAIKSKYRKAPRGVIVPPPPDELLALQAERSSVILGAVDRLQSAFGPAQFLLF